MYTLTLTANERKAIDWIGGRYAHGHDLYKILMQCPSNEQWDSSGDVTYQIPEHKAWEINEMGNNCNFIWDCLSSDFAKKLNDFCMAIV